MKKIEKDMYLKLMEFSDETREKKFVSGIQFTFDLTRNNAKLLIGVGIRKEYLLDDDIDEIALEFLICRDDMKCSGDISTVNGNIILNFNTTLNDENLDKLFLDFNEKLTLYVLTQT